MKIAFFSSTVQDRQWFGNQSSQHALTFIDEPLTAHTVSRAAGHRAVCVFAHDDLSAPILQTLKTLGIEVIALRCVGTDNVDLPAALELNISVLSIPTYSPYAVAEHAMALLMALNRHIPLASERVRAGNFTLDGLMGQDLHGKTVGVVGTGRIGRAFIRIMLGFGCRILAHDLRPNPDLFKKQVRLVSLKELLAESDVVSLHCPLTSRTELLLDAPSLALMKPTALLVNTSRGKLVDTVAVLNALDNDQLAGYAADVYADETPWFHRDFTGQPIADAVLNRLRQHPRALLTAHQGFLTQEALQQITRNLLLQLSFFENSQLEAIPKASLY